MKFFLTARSLSEAATFCLGRLVGSNLSAGTIVLLNGDLGAGKTVFVRGAGDALGASNVRSPSFTLVNEYETERFLLVHADLYRLEPGGADDLGLDDLSGMYSVLLVEWPDRWRFVPSASQDILSFSFSAPCEAERLIELSAGGEAAERLAGLVLNEIQGGRCPDILLEKTI